MLLTQIKSWMSQEYASEAIADDTTTQSEWRFKTHPQQAPGQGLFMEDSKDNHKGWQYLTAFARKVILNFETNHKESALLTTVIRWLMAILSFKIFVLWVSKITSLYQVCYFGCDYLRVSLCSQLRGSWVFSKLKMQSYLNVKPYSSFAVNGHVR
jgi:hypothetical protein